MLIKKNKLKNIMSANDQSKSIGISTIPLTKLTVVMNNFILNTINHLNKISVKGDEKLAEFDEKLNDLEIMTTLLESKLNSLPQNITSTYPELQACNLDDLTPNITIATPAQTQTQTQTQVTQQTTTISTSAPSGGPTPPPPPPMVSSVEAEKIIASAPKVQVSDPNQEDQKIGGEGGELSPQEELDKFLEEYDDYKRLFKMLKLGIPTSGVRQKVVMNGMDEDVFNQLLELAHKAYPKISLE